MSYEKPLTTIGKLQTKYLRQDLSVVPPELVHSWVKEFLVQSAREPYWQPDQGKQFALRLRTAIASTGTGWKQVHASVDRLIKWVE